jgi:hypothetical protein
MSAKLSTEHLVQVLQRTGGARLECSGCTWSATITVYDCLPRPLNTAEYRQVAFEARALADAHRYSWDGRT